MKAGPDIALLAALIGDPARANMLAALMSGVALTAGELAREAGITPQTASTHLGRLEAGGLVTFRRQGRHRYVALSGPDVAAVLEGLMGLAARTGQLRTRPGPRDAALREARVCYDHLAGTRGVQMFEALQRMGVVVEAEGTLGLTAEGAGYMAEFGIDVSVLAKARRPMCRACLDWSLRRDHLAGGLGAALLTRLEALGWMRHLPGDRAIRFTPQGMRAFDRAFPLSNDASCASVAPAAEETHEQTEAE